MIQKKVCMLGALAVGKTSLVKRFVESVFSEKYHTTLGVKVDKKTIQVASQEVMLMLWDMEGEDDYNSIRMTYLRGASGYLLVADRTRRETLTVALHLKERVEKAMGPMPFLLLVNKDDLVTRSELREEDLELCRGRGWNVVSTSAKTGNNVAEAFHDLARCMIAS